jgi:hypothetical protein
MSTEYEVWLSDPNGTRLAVIPNDRITSLSYSLVTNAAGSLTLEVPRDAIPDTSIAADGRIELWRKPAGGSLGLEGQTIWLIQKMTRGVSASASYRRLTALSATTLLSRRSTMYFAGSAPVTVTAMADDTMKSVFFYNLGASANSAVTYAAGVTPSRIAPSVALDASVNGGPMITKEYAWRSVLSACQDLANDAATLGTPVYFGIVWAGAGLTFRTWIGQPGVDRTTGASQLVISPERGTLGGTVEVVEDWTDSATWVVAGGQGQQAARSLGQAYDAARIGQSPFGVREFFLNATSMSTAGSLNAEASAELYRRRPKKTLTGQLISVPGAIYGLDWGHGDRLIAQFEDESFEALVETVTVKLERGQEQIDAKITGEAA